MNIQCLRNKISEIELLASDLDSSFICLTEHWCRSSEMPRVAIPGFKLIDFSARTSFKNGGTCIFAKENLQCQVIPDKLKLYRDKDFEFSAIYSKDLDYKIICIYRAPSGDHNYFFKSLESLLSNLNATKSKILICADFNIDWLTVCPIQTELSDFLTSFNLSLLNQQPTRMTSHSATCIDYAATNAVNEDVRCNVLTTVISDHYGLSISLPPNRIHTNIKSFSRKFNDAKFDLFQHALANTDWSHSSDYNSFHMAISDLYDTHFPLTKCSSSNSKKSWVTDEVRRSCSDLKANFRQKLLDDSPESHESYNNAKKKHRKLISNAKKAANDSYFSSQDNKPKAIWNIVKRETGKLPCPMDKACKIKDASGSPFLAPKLQANYVNNFFCSIASSMQSAISAQPIRAPQPCPHEFSLVPATTEEVAKCIKDIKNKACPDIDGISTKVLKTCSAQLIPVLTDLINDSFSTGIFPDKLKIAKVLPIYKGKGSISDVNNYRPISILPVFSKVFESIVKRRLIKFLSDNELLNKSQHGFLPNKSTETAILDFTKNVLEGLENGDKVTGVFLDLSKAFDSVDHTVLIDKLAALGVKNNALNWFKSYLSNRKQSVAIDYFNATNSTIETCYSESLDVKLGVPQGSVLGPLLFLIYINDMSSSLTSGISKSVLYADDTNVLFAHRNPHVLQDLAQSDINNVVSFFHSNLLTINESKSNLINFSSRSTDSCVELSVNNSNLISVESTKFLGVVIDSRLNWHEHVITLRSKLEAVNFTQRILVYSLNRDYLRTAYFAYFHSLLSYGIPFWGCQKQNLEAVFVAQKKCIRIMTNKNPGAHCKPLFADLSIMPVPCVYIYRCVLLVRSMSGSLSLNSDYHDYNTRRRNDFSVPSGSTSRSQNGPIPSGIRMYNALPTEIKSVSDPIKFKSQLKTFLLDRLYYCVEELYTDS